MGDDHMSNGTYMLVHLPSYHLNSPGLWPRACSDPSCTLVQRTLSFFLASSFFFLSAGPFPSFYACAYLGAALRGPRGRKSTSLASVFWPVSAQNRTLDRFVRLLAPLEKYQIIASISACILFWHFSIFKWSFGPIRLYKVAYPPAKN